jgi:diguanylate cyclase (GGDEF)-like protein/putative nucleotidyltransferase with HDIG domain
MSSRINIARTLDAVLDELHGGIIAGLRYDRVSVWLSDETGAQLEELRGTDVDGTMMGPRDHVLSLTGDTTVDRIPGLIPLLHGVVSYYLLEPADTPIDAPALLKGPPTQKLLIALRSSEAVTGMIVLDNALSGQPIAVDRAGVLLALASQAGTAIQNIRLQAQERNEHARLSMLVAAAHALNSTLNSDQILRELAMLLVTGLKASNVVFEYVNAADRTCVMVAQETAPGREPIPPDDPEVTFYLYPIIEKVVITGEPFFARMGDQDVPQSERDFLRGHALQAELLVPITMRGETIALLEIYWDRIGTISVETMELCSAIAQQISVALGNARLFADVSRRAEIDALTGLYNHSALIERIDRAVTEASSFSLVLLDIDNFKLFNDTYGHMTGNAVLTSITTAIHETCRAGDTGGRYGGDELALILPGATMAESDAVLQRIVDAIVQRPHVLADGSVIPISVSVGAAYFPEDGHTRQALMAVADASMYDAKRRTNTKPGVIASANFSRSWPDVHLRDAADLLGDSPFGVLEGLVSSVDAKDRYTREHSEHVTHLSLLLLDILGLPADQRRVLTIAGLLHDVGKIGVPSRILQKPGPLTKDEYTALKRHVSYGVAIIGGVLADKDIVDAVAYHHERWDGGGYPHGLPGPATPILARIMQVADAASSMLLDRPYRKGLDWQHVVSELQAGAGGQFDPALVGPFIGAFETYQQHGTEMWYGSVH